MSIISQLCEQLCPLHPTIVCCEELNHQMPHRAVLIGARLSNRIVVEWRPAHYDASCSNEDVFTAGVNMFEITTDGRTVWVNDIRLCAGDN